MRSRERLAETLRSINIRPFEAQASGYTPSRGWLGFFHHVARMVEQCRADPDAHAELYLIKTEKAQ